MQAGSYNRLAAGDVLANVTGGGGGFGNPFERPHERVLTDVVNGFVSIRSAAADYGVVIDPGTLTVDVEATSALRSLARTVAS